MADRDPVQVAVLIARLLREHGVDQAFGLPGGPIQPVRDQLARRSTEISGRDARTTDATGAVCLDLQESRGLVPENHPATFRTVPCGEEGTSVRTHLERTSQPMIRLAFKKLTRWTRKTNCCGRTYPKLPRGVYGRIDDLIHIRGENVHPTEVDNFLLGVRVTFEAVDVAIHPRAEHKFRRVDDQREHLRH